MLIKGRDVIDAETEEEALKLKEIVARRKLGLREVPMPEEEKDNLLKAKGEAPNMRIQIESAGDETIEEAEFLVASFTGKADAVMNLVGFVLEAMEARGGGITDIQHYEREGE